MREFLIAFLLHVLYACGVLLLIRPLLEQFIRKTFKEIDYKRKLKMQLFADRMEQMKSGLRFVRHLDQLLYLAKTDYETGKSVIRYIFWMIVLPVSVFIVSFLLVDRLPNHLEFNNPFLTGIELKRVGDGILWPFPFFSALLTLIFMYYRLRIRYERRSVESSYDLMEVVKMMAKFSHLSTDVALDQTANLLSKNNVLKRPVRTLSLLFSSYNNEKELHNGVQIFSKIIGTTFAISLCSDMLYMEREGAGFWQDSLLTLSSKMEQQRDIINQVKNNSKDAISLGMYGNILVFIMCVGTLVGFLGLNVYIRLQFQTKIGLSFLILIMAGLFLSFILSQFLSRPKLDYQ